MTSTKPSFQKQAALARTAIPGYRILRRIVALQRAGAYGVRHVGGMRRADTQTYPLAAE